MLRFADLRLDTTTLKELPDGSIKVTGQLTHPGIFDYRNPDGSLRREYRPPDEVFRQDALQTFAGVTVTRNHPPPSKNGRKVSADTWKQVAIGNVGDTVREDGGHVVADIYVREAKAVAEVKAGRLKHISCGYDVDYDPTPGTSPDGHRYDGVQRNIRGNHVALLPDGVAPRGGAECVLRLDSNGDELKSDVDLETALAKIAALEGELAKTRTDAAEATGLKTQIAELEAKIAQLNEQLAPARLDALCDARAAVVGRAKAEGIALTEKDANGNDVARSSLALKRAIVAKRTPDLAARVDSMSEEAIDAVMAVYATQPHPSMNVLGIPHTDPASAKPSVVIGNASRADAASLTGVPKIGDLQAKHAQASRDAWKNAGDKPGKVTN